MSSNIFVSRISRENANKYPYIKPALDGEGISDLIVSLGDAEGFSTIWISPNYGWMLDAMKEHVAGIHSGQQAYSVTKAQCLGVLEVCRKVVERDKDDLDPDTEEYLLKEYDEFEELVRSFDFEKDAMFMRYC